MTWTTEQKLDALLRVRWTLIPETTPEGDRLVRVAELPSVVGSGMTESELAADLWASLHAALEAYLHFGDPIPLPEGVSLPWERRATHAPGVLSIGYVRRAPDEAARQVERAGETAGEIELEVVQ